MQEAAKVMKDPGKSRADIAARSRKIYERVAKMKLAWLYPTD